jgi:hypothetical protein
VNGPHVLQCGPQAQDEDVNDDHLDDRELALKPFAERGLASLFYPEYSPLFPHEKWTLGMTGRPGGPDWYINKQNNTVGHAPGGQSQFPLADMYGDPCFAKVIDGFDALEKVFTQPTIQSGDYRFFFEHPIIVKAEIVSPIVPQLKPWQVQPLGQGKVEQQQPQPNGAQQAAGQQQDPPKQQELPQQQAVASQGQQQQQEQQPLQQQQQQPLQQQQQQSQTEQVQQQAPQDAQQQQQQQQGQQQGVASAEGGKPVEFVNDQGGAGAIPADGAAASGGGKRMRQLMMAKLPPLNVEP